MSDRRKGIRNLWKPLAIALILSVAIGNLTSTSMFSYAQPMTTFKVEPETNTGSVGGFITVAFNAYDVEDLWGWQVFLTWNTAVLDYTSHTFGDTLAGQPSGTVQSADTDYVDDGEFLFSEVSYGGDPGVTVDSGWLGNVTFEILGLGETTLQIDHTEEFGWTYWLDSDIVTYGDEVGEMIKEDGVFFHFDFNEDGIIDIFDIAMVARDYGGIPIQTGSPSSSTTDGWTTPANAYVSDDAYASCGAKNKIATYSVYGFNTGSWTGVAEVKVGIEHYSPDGNEKIEIYVSGDGGSNYVLGGTVFPVATEVLEWVDVTGALSWTPGMLSDASLRVQIKHVVVGGAKTSYVDWLPVRVQPEPQAYSPYTDLNGDGAIDIFDLSMIAQRFGERT